MMKHYVKIDKTRGISKPGVSEIGMRPPKRMPSRRVSAMWRATSRVANIKQSPGTNIDQKTKSN